MKKFLFVAVFTVIGVSFSNAQQLKAGIHAGYPFGSTGENFSAMAALDVSYTFEIARSLQLGGLTGYGQYFGKEIDADADQVDMQGEGFGYIPIAASAKYAFGYYDNWHVGLDLGYALGIGDENAKDLGGFYNAIKFGWQNDLIEVYAFYQGIGASETKSSTSGNLTTSTTSAQLATAGLGIAYKFQ